MATGLSGRPRVRPAAPRARRHRGGTSWLARNRLWVVVAPAAVMVLVVVAALVVRDRGDGGDGAGSAGSSAEPVVGDDLHSVVVDPSRPERVFLGGHEAVATSSDGGRTWSSVPTLQGADAMGWAFTEDAVWVSGHPGLSRSTDGGRTFVRADEGLPDTDVHALGSGPGVLYAASPGVGLFATTDGGRSWQVRSADAGHTFAGRIVVDPDRPEHLMAADVSSGVMESADGGRRWRRLEALPAASWLSRTGPGMANLVASGPHGAARTADGGRSWQPLQLPEGATVVEASTSRPGLFYAAGHDGDRVQLWVSHDGARTWGRP